MTVEERPAGARPRRAWGLVLACHPVPTVVITGLGTALVVALDGDRLDAVRLALCVLAGQLSVGWSNDARDADGDRAADRQEKPLVQGIVATPTVWRAAILALALSIGASFALLGVPAGAWHVTAVASAWAYNLVLKDTVVSPLPYALSFAAVPMVVAGVVDPTSEQPWSLSLACALAGVAAHLANTAPDVESDRSVGRGGLACRIGSPWARVGCVALLAIAALVLVVTGDVGHGAAAGLGGLVGLVALAALLRDGAWLFRMVLGVTLVGVVVVLTLA